MFILRGIFLGDMRCFLYRGLFSFIFLLVQFGIWYLVFGQWRGLVGLFIFCQKWCFFNFCKFRVVLFVLSKMMVEKMQLVVSFWVLFWFQRYVCQVQEQRWYLLVVKFRLIVLGVQFGGIFFECGKWFFFQFFFDVVDRKVGVVVWGWLWVVFNSGIEKYLQ